jgi:hypothetical protein
LWLGEPVCHGRPAPVLRRPSSTGRDPERETGFPFDVECAYENGWVYLLRCRAVTALDGMRDV